MTTTDAVLEKVRNADPIGGMDIAHWSRSAEGRRVFDVIVGTNVVAIRAPRRHRARWVGGAAVVTGALASAAAAATGVLGDPAPESIRAELAAVDRGLPEDLRMNPDVENAMAVAITAAGVLYAAEVTGGGYCYEIASEGDQTEGAVCVRPNDLDDRAIEVTAPIPSDEGAPLLVGGRINDDRVERLVARYPNGVNDDVALGLSGYWLFEVPEDARDAALAEGFQIVGLGADDAEEATEAVPPLRDDEPDGAKDSLQPIFVSTVSDEHDLTLVLGIEGTVNVAGASTLELHYPDATITPIALGADGSFRLDLPAERHDDFADAWGQVVARDARGTMIATDTFTSVANHQRES